MATSEEISKNRKALRDFQIIETFEAGLQLVGTEVKSIRAGLANINNGFVRIERGEAWLYDADIQAYDKASFSQHAPRRARKLLLHKKEIAKMAEYYDVDGLALVALRMYWKDHRVKVAIGVGKGKHARDKREDLKKRTVQRETDREVATFNRKRG